MARKPLTHCVKCGLPRSSKNRVCQPCDSAYTRQWRLNHPGHAKAYRDRFKGYQRRFYYDKKYGVTLEEVDRILIAQGGGCAICGSKRPRGGRFGQWQLDHCHNSQQIRGVLCGSCNRGLGLFGDSIANLEKAISYLEQPAIQIEKPVRQLVLIKG